MRVEHPLPSVLQTVGASSEIMQELCFKEGSEILAFFQAEKGRENRFIVLLGGSTGCRTWLHSSADFLSLSLSPSPRFLPNCNRAPLSPVGLRPWPGTESALGMCPHWGHARAGDVPALGMCPRWAISSPVSWSAHMCACGGVTSAGPGLLLGLAKRLPVLGRVPSLACGQGWAGEWTCTESWGLTAGSWEPGVTGQAEGGRRRGRLSRGP